MRLIDADALEKNLSNDLPYKASVKRVLIQAPTVETIPKGAYEQVKWERDMAIQQLNDYGVQLGEKTDCVRVVRCKDCAFWQDNNNGYPHPDCRWVQIETPDADDYCSLGNRRGD